MRRYSEFGVAKKKTAKKKTTHRKKAAASSTASSRRQKTTKKAVSKKKTASKKAVSKKKSVIKKKAATKKAASKKAASKKKATTKKATTKKAASKKKATTKKAASKKKTTKKVATKKAASKKAASKKTGSKMAASKKTGSKKTAAKKVDPPTRRKRRQTVVEAVLASETDSRGFVIVNGRRIRRISAEATKKTRKRSSSAVDSAKIKKPEDDKPVKTKLSRQELKQFRELLISKRKELLAAVDSMEFEALRSDDGDTSSMPIHMADVGSDAYEQDLMLGMAASERQRIRDIDDALERIRLQTYGVCELTKKQISKKRLNAKPWAKYTIDSARKIERGL
ncbi:MAG: TraR/DksA C4-type zinc finger protein [Phycisphaerales bacterium]|nr:TraR/DksA C4-type zinc finger protein [Phycisphaerales bacterium]